MARLLLARARVRVGALYPLLTTSVALVTYGVASLAFGSGFLAVYVAGNILGNARLPRHATLLRAHDFLAWTAQIVMFVMLGLLAYPSRVAAVAPKGLGLAALLTFVARPAAMAVCLAPFGFRVREILLVAWVGLRGAVPIVLALIPVLGRSQNAHVIFDVVFFVVLVSALVQGGTIRWVTRWLDLGADIAPKPEALVEIESTRALDEEILTFFVSGPLAVCGAKVGDVPFPPRSFIMLIVRSDDLISPKGDTVITEGDHVFVLCPPDEIPTIRLLFGAPQE